MRLLVFMIFIQIKVIQIFTCKIATKIKKYLFIVHDIQLIFYFSLFKCGFCLRIYILHTRHGSDYQGIYKDDKTLY